MAHWSLADQGVSRTMSFVYVDWQPQVIGCVNSEGALIGHRGSPAEGSLTGEMEALELGVQLSSPGDVVLSDCKTSVTLVLRPDARPHERASDPDKLKKMAAGIRKNLNGRMVAWIPRQANLAHTPLAEFWRNYV